MPYEEIKVYNPEAFTVVGTPTIDTNGIASGFTNNNYVTVTPLLSNNFKISCKLTATANSSTNKTIFVLYLDNNNTIRVAQAFNFYFLNGKINSTNLTFSKSQHIEPVIDDIYSIDLNYNNGILQLLINGVVAYETTVDLSSFIAANPTLYIGKNPQGTNTYPYQGSIDLKAVSIKINNITVFKGYKYETIYIKPDFQQYLTDIKDYYADLLILQYRNKYKARETVKTGVDIYTGDGVVFDLSEILNLDIAVGAQLDLIGKILGCPRNVPGLVINTKYFSFHVDASSIGFSTVGNPQYGYAKTRANSVLATYGMQDEEYRTVLRFKAFVNRWSGTMAEMDEALYICFGNDINLQNNQDLSITYDITNNTIPIQAARLLGYLKAPLGVAVNFNTP